MKDATIAARYARGLFILTEKRRETAAALEDLQSLRVLLAPGKALTTFLLAPHLRVADKRTLVAGALAGRANRALAEFVDLLLRKKRLALLAEITDEYEALVERSQGIQRAHVVSAVPLTDAERTRLLAALERRTKGTIRLTAGVDPSVVGGALVRIGDRVVDRTVQTLLESIAAQLYEVSV